MTHWRHEETARANPMDSIKDILNPGLARLHARAVPQKCSAVFEHVYESYPERDAGVYAGAV
jgi:type I restriction enzyme R subunit